jgi:hypothetical protein
VDWSPQKHSDFSTTDSICDPLTLAFNKLIEHKLNAEGVITGRGGVLVEAIGYADCFPLPGNDNTTEEHRQKNRRIEIVFER